MENNEKTISELIDSLNSSIEDIRHHPIKTDKTKLPSDFEILTSGINGAQGLTLLFSPNVDKLIGKLFQMVIDGDYDDILRYQNQIKAVADLIFGEGSFEGQVSTRVLNSLQNTMSSYKYNTMKSYLGKTVTTLKKTRLIMKNLKKDSKGIQDKEELQKYRESIYAIKQVLKIAEKIYRNRKFINRKVCSGINNIVHEEEIRDSLN